MELNKKKSKSRSTLILIAIFLLLLLFIAGCAGSSETPALLENEGTSELSGSINPPEDTEDANIILTIEITIGLLLLASLVGIVTERLRVPYTTGLVLIGLVLAFGGRQDINVSPQLILGLLVPPLIYEAAFQVKARDLLRDLAPIISLAIPGVLLTTFLVGGVLYWGT